MKKDTEITKVIFRKWNKKMDSCQSVIAMFPDEGWGAGLVASYEHVGQHGAADYHHVVINSKLATPEEYENLKKELEGIGYNLKVVQKKTFSRVKKAIDKIMGIC